MHTPRRRPDRPMRLLALLPALLLILSVGGPMVVRAQDAIPLEPVEDPAYGLATVVPEGWTNLGQGIRARKPDASDSVLLVVQSAPVAEDDIWPFLLPRLGLDTPPAPVETRPTDALTWTLYQVDVKPPLGDVRVDLAAASADGTTYLVMLQSPPDGAAALRDAVFLPAVDALRPVSPEPTPDPATLPYDVEEVTFSGGAADVTLAGTLTIPRTPGPHPGIVLVSGSGPSDRDENLRPIAAIKPFALLADALTRAGIAVLRYDDRGTAASTGDYAAAGLGGLTADAAAAVGHLRGDPRIDPARVGLLGHSEGGIILASLIEAGTPLAFGVSMAGPATNGLDLLVAQYQASRRSQGASDEEVAEIGELARALFDAVLADDLDAARAAVTTYFGSLWDRQPPATQKALGDREAFVAGQVAQQLAVATAGEFVEILRSDPTAGWAAARIPVLGVFGGKDVQVPADLNAPLLADLIAASDPASEVVTLPDANHLFQRADTGSQVEYGSLEQTFTPDFLPLVVGWVAERVGLAVPGASPGG